MLKITITQHGWACFIHLSYWLAVFLQCPKTLFLLFLHTIHEDSVIINHLSCNNIMTPVNRKLTPVYRYQVILIKAVAWCSRACTQFLQTTNVFCLPPPFCGLPAILQLLSPTKCGSVVPDLPSVGEKNRENGVIHKLPKLFHLITRPLFSDCTLRALAIHSPASRPIVSVALHSLSYLSASIAAAIMEECHFLLMTWSIRLCHLRC